MKIMQVIPCLTEAGGEVFVVDLCNELCKNHDVTLVVFFDNKEGDFVHKKIDANIKTIYLHKELGFQISVTFKLKKIINNLKPDVIHTHLDAVNYILSAVPLIPKVKIFHTVHSDAFEETSSKLRNIKYWFHKFGIVKAVTISKASDDSFRKAYKGISTILIDNGRSLEEPSEKANDVKEELERIRDNENKVIVNVGSLSFPKNQSMLIDAINDLVNESLKISLCIIGGKRPGEEEIYQHINSNTNNNIRYLGKKSNVIDYLMYADAFCLASRFEGLPISLLEAISVGCIPICTPVGGIPQIVEHQKSGFLANGIDKEDLKTAIRAWYNTKDNRLDEISTECKRIYDTNYTMKACAEKYITAFNN